MADVKIDIPGIGEVTATNVASESTLRDILKALGGRPKPAQKPSGGGIGDETTKNLEDLGDAAEDTGDALASLGKKAAGATLGAFNLLTSAIGATVGSVVGMGSELIAGGNKLTDFAQYLPIPGLTMFTGLLDNQIDQFRELSQVGGSFGNNMFELTRIAGEAAIPQEDFAKLVAEQASSLRLFGNSVNSGSRNFASMSKELRQGGLGPRLMAMGFTTQELNENLISYNEMMTVSGRRRYMSDQDLIQGAQQYSMELDKISKLTGKSRKQLEDEMKQKNLDIRRQMAIAKYGEEYALRLEQAAAVSPQFEAALLDMADGVANEPLTRQLMAQSDTFRNQVGKINSMTAEEFNNFTRTVADEGMAFANRMGDAGVQASSYAGTATGEFLAVVGQLQRTRETVDGLTEDEQKQRDAITEKLANFAEIVNDIRGQIQVALLDSGIFQDIKEGFANMIPDAETAKEMYAEASRVFKENILPSLNSFWDWLKGDGFTTAKNAIMDAFGTISSLWDEHGPAIKSFFTDLMSDPKKVWDETVWPALKEGFLGFFNDFDWGGAAVTALGLLTAAFIGLNPFSLLASTLIAGIVGFIGWDNIKTFFTEKMGDFGTAISEMITNAITGVKDWFSGVWDSMFGGIQSFSLTQWIGEKIDSILSWFKGLFSIDIGGLVGQYIPNWAKRWLPDSWFAGPSETASTSSSPSPAEIEQAEADAGNTTQPQTSQTARTNENATSTQDTNLAMLNTNMLSMVDLMRTQNRILRQMDGNLVG